MIDQSKLNPKCIEIQDNSVNMDSINKKIQANQVLDNSNFTNKAMSATSNT